eukprot:SAG22_NODE_399_length_11094_cov_5.593452_7_plen_115_part_00
MDQLLQELIVARARELIFPQLDAEVKTKGFPPPVARMVKKQVQNMAEEDLRRAVHDQVVAGYDALMQEVTQLPEGFPLAPEVEEGEEVDEDEFGFVVREGGYRGEATVPHFHYL